MSNENQTYATAPPPQPPPPRPPADPFVASAAQKPVRAAVCALIPGIGAVYNREYEKAVIHFSIFAGLAYMADTIPVFGLAAFCFYVFTVIDAYRSAEAIVRRGGLAKPQDEQLNLPLWGGILVLMGVMFLLDNLGAIRLRAAMEFWPLLLIFLGLYLVFGYFRKPGRGGQQPPEMPPPVVSEPIREPGERY